MFKPWLSDHSWKVAWTADPATGTVLPQTGHTPTGAGGRGSLHVLPHAPSLSRWWGREPSPSIRTALASGDAPPRPCLRTCLWSPLSTQPFCAGIQVLVHYDLPTSCEGAGRGGPQQLLGPCCGPAGLAGSGAGLVGGPGPIPGLRGQLQPTLLFLITRWGVGVIVVLC